MDWKESAKLEYIRSGLSLRELAEKIGKPYSTVRKVAAADSWTDARNKAEAIAEQKTIEHTANQKANIDSEVYAMAGKLLKKLGNVSEKKALTPKDIRSLTAALKDIKEITGVKSEADMREQDARIRKLEKEIAKSEAEASEINVSMEGMDEWAE